MGLAEDLFNIGNGIRSGIQDVPSFVGNIISLDVPGAVTDARKIVGDFGDVLKGLEGLGVSLGSIPSTYGGTVGKIADSPILSAAQLTIEGQKALTGSGDPEAGNGFKESAAKLNEAWDTLYNAVPEDNQWDGAASIEYTAINEAHVDKLTQVEYADEALAKILSIEAGQVSRTRETLDTTSQALYDFGLSIVWMNVPAFKAAKMAAETTAAAAALATTTTSMTILAKNSLENASRIRDCGDKYTAAAKDTSGDGGMCGTFVDPKTDMAPGNLPRRTDPNEPYTMPHPTYPWWFDIPVTPMESNPSAPRPPTPAASPSPSAPPSAIPSNTAPAAHSTGTAPASSKRPPAPSPASMAPSYRPGPAEPVTRAGDAVLGTPSLPEAAGPATGSGPRAPVDTPDSPTAPSTRQTT